MSTFHAKKNHAGHSNHISTPPSVSSPLVMIRNFAIELGGILGFGLLILLLCTFIAHRSADPNAWVQPLSLVSLYLTALFTGIISERIHAKSALLCGLISGVVLLLAGILLGICIPSDDLTSTNYIYTFLFRLPVPILSVLCAYLAQKRPQKRSRHKRR